MISCLVKLTDCGGLSIYLYIEEGPAMRVNASISEREAVEESSTSVVCRNSAERGWRCVEKGVRFAKRGTCPLRGSVWSDTKAEPNRP